MKSVSKLSVLITTFALHGCVYDITTFPSFVYDVNDSNIAVGSGTPTPGVTGPLKFLPDGRHVRLATTPGCADASPKAINNDGVITGTCWGPDGARVILWDASGTATDIGQIAPNWSTLAQDINSAGTVVGDATLMHNIDTPSKAWVYEAGSFRELPLLPGSEIVNAVSINDHGQIAGFGWVNDPANGLREVAIRWAAGTRSPSILPEHPHCSRLRVVAINNSGTIVGNCHGGFASGGVLVWRPDGRAPTLLHSGSAVRFSAGAINDSGTIVGAASLATGDSGGQIKPLRLTANGTPQIHETPETLAVAINESGYTLGARYTDPARNNTVVVRIW